MDVLPYQLHPPLLALAPPSAPRSSHPESPLTQPLKIDDFETSSLESLWARSVKSALAYFMILLRRPHHSPFLP